jgi:hypothetical protein
MPMVRPNVTISRETPARLPQGMTVKLHNIPGCRSRVAGRLKTIRNKLVKPTIRNPEEANDHARANVRTPRLPFL